MKTSGLPKLKEITVTGSTPAPHPELAGVVRYWRLTSHGKTVRRSILLAPDEHMDVIFDLHAPGGARTPTLMGMQRKTVLFKTGRPVELIGIKFLPGSFFSLFRVPAGIFSGKSVPLKAALGRRATDFARVFAGKDHGARIKLLDTLLLGFARMKEPLPPEIKLALENIYARKGALTVRELAENAGWTRRWFSEVFSKWVGASPQLFCGNIKFVATVRELNAGKKAASVAQETGYSDQPHLTRSFKSSMGLTPGAVFRLKGRKKIVMLED